MLDRTQSPAATPLVKVDFPEVSCSHLNNGIPVYSVQFGSQEIAEINVVFPAGKSFEPQASVSGFTSKLMQDGTEKYTGLEFARKLDEFGAFLHSEIGFESVTWNLSSLTKHLDSTLSLLSEVLLRPSFPLDDLQVMKSRSIQHLDVEEKKTAYTARKEFNQLLHGPDHPYGTVAGKEDIGKLENEALRRFHKSNFSMTNAFWVIVGRFDEEKLMATLNREFGAQDLVDEKYRLSYDDSPANKAPSIPQKGLHYFEKPDSMQATVRVGHRAFARHNEDYYRVQVVNTVLGGYFGSRLMKNIREDKGYTYGIGSAWLSMKFNGIFVIQGDVGNEYIQPTLKEIRKELELLIDKGVGENELQLVKTYMLGRSASSRETPTQIANLIKGCLVNQLPFSSLDSKFEIIQSVTTTEFKALAEKYFRPEEMLEVVSGKM